MSTISVQPNLDLFTMLVQSFCDGVEARVYRGIDHRKPADREFVEQASARTRALIEHIEANLPPEEIQRAILVNDLREARTGMARELELSRRFYPA